MQAELSASQPFTLQKTARLPSCPAATCLTLRSPDQHQAPTPPGCASHRDAAAAHPTTCLKNRPGSRDESKRLLIQRHCRQQPAVGSLLRWLAGWQAASLGRHASQPASEASPASPDVDSALAAPRGDAATWQQAHCIDPGVVVVQGVQQAPPPPAPAPVDAQPPAVALLPAAGSGGPGQVNASSIGNWRGDSKRSLSAGDACAV